MGGLFRLVKVALLVMCVITNSYASDYQVIIEKGTDEELSVLKQKALQQGIAKQSLGRIMEWSALQLVGQPYVARLLDEKSPEYLYISLTATDCMLFVEEVVAVSQLIRQNKLNPANLSKNIEQLRYHGNVEYCQRNHYFKDWALSNISQGFFVDEGYILTRQFFPYSAYVLGNYIKNDINSLHTMDLECIREREQIINSASLGFIPLQKLPKHLKDIKSGDIIGIVRSPNQYADAVHHLGIAYVHKGVVGMINASSDAKRVVVADSLLGYLRKFKDSQGITLLRVVN